MDCLDAKWLVQAVVSDGRGFTDDEERDEFQRAVDHVCNCGCESCHGVREMLDGIGIPISIGQAQPV